MDFQELLNLLRRNRMNLILLPILSGIIAFSLRFFLSERMFTSESQISTGLTIANDYMGEEGRLRPFEISVSFENLIENMKSKMVVNRLSYKILYHDLTNEDAFRKPEFSKIVKPQEDSLGLVLNELKEAIDNYALINRSSDVGSYIYELLDEYKYNEKELLSNVHIYRIGSTDFINIRFTSERPVLSAYMVNLWADNFIGYYDYQNSKLLNESLSVLSQLLAEKKSGLEQRTAKLNKYKTRYSLYDNEAETDPIAEYERLIRETNSNVNSLNYRLQNVRNQIAALDNSKSYNGRKKIIGLKNELDKLNTRLIDEPRNRQLKDSIELLGNQLETEMYAQGSTGTDKKKLDDLFKQENSLKIEYDIAIADLQNLNRQYSKQKGSVIDLASSKSQQENLETEVQQARDEYVSAQNKFNQAKSHLVSGSGAVKLSYYGDEPEDPQSRKTVIFSILGLIMGLVMTLFVLIFMEITDGRINNPIKFKREYDLPLNGTIENYKILDRNLRSIISGEYEGVKPEFSNGFEQSLQKLRFEIQGLSNKTILFTSTRENSGKTFLLTSLAYSLSLIQKRVLIIDTNFRNNTLSQELAPDNAENETGMHVLVENENVRNEVIKNVGVKRLTEKKVILPTKNQNIFVLKCNKYQKTPEEVFSLINFEKVIEHLKDEFDYVFMEGANLNEYSDSKELSKYADYLVGVFSVEDEISSLDKQQVEFIKSNDSKLILTILNKVKSEDVI